MDQLHEYEFTLFLIDVSLDVVRAHLRSRVGPIAGAWLLIRPNTLLFHLTFAHFLLAFHIHLSIPYPIVPHLS